MNIRYWLGKNLKILCRLDLWHDWVINGAWEDNNGWYSKCRGCRKEIWYPRTREILRDVDRTSFGEM